MLLCALESGLIEIMDGWSLKYKPVCNNGRYYLDISEEHPPD
jgi:hypothetical protein